jgi:WD40 repeat protein
MVALACGLSATASGSSVPRRAKPTAAVGTVLCTRSLSAGTGVSATVRVDRPETGDDEAPTLIKPRVDAFGDPLPNEALSRLGTIRLRHWQAGWIAFTSDGTNILTQREGFGSTRIWNRSTGRLLRSLPGSTSDGVPPWPGAFEPACNLLTSADRSGVRLWKVHDGTLARTVCTGTYEAAAVSRDGSRVVARVGRTGGRTIEMWDAVAGRRLWSWTAAEGGPLGAVFAPDGKSVVTGNWEVIESSLDRAPGNNRKIRFLDTATGKERSVIDMGKAQAERFALSGDGRLLATVGYSNSGDEWEREVRLWDTRSGSQNWRWRAPGDVFCDVKFTPDRTALALVVGDGVLFLDTATGKKRGWAARDRCELALGLAFSPEGNLLAVCGRSAIRLLDWTTGTDISPVADAPASVVSMGITADGATVATIGSRGRTLLLWDSANGRVRRTITLDEPEYWFVVAPDARTAYSKREEEKALRVWDLAAGQPRGRVPVGFDQDWSWPWLAISGDVLAISHGDYGLGTVALLHPGTGRVLQSMKRADKEATRMTLTPDGTRLCVCYADRSTRVWDVVTGKVLREIGPVGDQFAGFAVLSPDGKWVATPGCHLATAHFYIACSDAATGQIVRRLDAPNNWSQSGLLFSPDSRSIACFTQGDPRIRVIEMATGKERRVLTGPAQSLIDPVFSADGKRLVSSSDEGAALVWDLAGRLSAGQKWDRPPTRDELDKCWKTMAGEEAATAYDALRRLAAAPAESVPYLAERLRPIANADAKEVRRLIEELDSDQFPVRDKAGRALDGLGEAAAPVCREALKARLSAEVRRRLEALVKQTAQPVYYATPDSLRQARAVEALELAGTPDAHRLLERLASGAAHAWLTQNARESLDRLTKLARGGS